MKKFQSRFKFILLMLISILMLSACSGDKKEGEEKEKGKDPDVKTEEKSQEVTIQMSDDPDFFDPHLATASITERMIFNMFEGLLAPETDGSIKPGLAEDYQVSDDGLTYTFNLRKNVKFHNGDPVTVEDIQYSFERLMGVGTGEPLSSKFKNVESLESPSEDVFIIRLSEANSAFLFFLTMMDSPIIPKSNDGNHNDSPIGTGPFKYIDYNPGSDIVLGKNEDYWKEGIPYLDKLTFKIQPDAQTALLSMQAGQIDLMDVPPHRIPEVENDFNLLYKDNNSTLIIGFNHDREPFNDVRVRQAINYAVSKEDIIDAAFSGYATKLGSNMSPAMETFYLDGLQNTYEVNQEKAKSLLAEAGYPDGFSTTISVSAHNAMYTQLAQVAVENLREVGINVEIEVVEWGVWLERIYQGFDYDMTAIDFTGKLSPHDILNRYHSETGNNFIRFNNAEYDELMENVLKESELDKQVEMYQRAQEILTEEAAAVFVADYQLIWTLNPELEGYKQYPFYFHDMSEVRFKE